MSKKLVGLVIMAILLAGCIYYVPYDRRGAPTPRPPAPQPYEPGFESLNSSYFYDYLDPYGIWVRYSPYGYVWVPRDVGSRWRPYSRGHWIWTDYGWNWVSAERWGWLVFHYGRWGWARGLGWYWVPDTLWGPSWVIWRAGDLYLGWTPIPPGIDLRPGVGYGRWNNVRVPGDHWIFVRASNFFDRSLDRWILPFERNVTIINMTVLHADIKFRGNRAVNEGLSFETARRVTNRTVDRYELKDAKRAEDSRIEGREAVIYRPEVSKTESARPKSYLESDQARQQIERGELSPSVRRTEGAREEAGLVDRHNREATLLKESQDDELSLIRKKAEAERAKVSNPEAKKKIESQFNARLSEIKKKHEQEKAELAKRQQEEKDKEEKVSKARIKKKIEKD